MRSLARRLILVTSVLMISCDNVRTPYEPCPGWTPGATRLCDGEGDRVLRHFLEMVTSLSGMVWKWDQPTTITVYGAASLDSQFVAAAATRLEQVSGHPIRIVPDTGRVVVRFVPRADFPLYMGNVWEEPPYGVTRYLGVNGQLTGALVLVGTDPNVDRQVVTLHEMAHVIGSLDHPRDYPSILNGRQLTLEDSLVFATLYGGLLRAGMTLEEAEAALGL